MLIAEVAVAKAPKYAVRESGDTVEVVERPHGGLSIVMADGQRSGRSAKAISNIAVRKAVSLLAEGVRDGAVARAAHDYLRTARSGQVSAELTIISVDLETRTLVISRNSQCPVLVGGIEMVDGRSHTTWQSLDEPVDPIGIHVRSRPAITEFPLAAGQTVVAFTDGVLHAGTRRGAPLVYQDALAALAGPPRGAVPHAASSGGAHDDVTLSGSTGMTPFTADEVADGLLAAALAADAGRPADDISVVAVCVFEAGAQDEVEVRRMRVSFPVGVGT